MVPRPSSFVWEHNNLAQKNLTVVALKPGQWILVPFVANNLNALTTRRVLIEVVRPKEYLHLPVMLAQKSGVAFDLVPELKTRPLDVIPATTLKDSDGVPLDCGGHLDGNAFFIHVALTSETLDALAARQFADAVEITFANGLTAQIPLSLHPAQQMVIGLRVTVPQTAKAGEVLNLDLVQKDEVGKTIMGGIALQIRVS